MAREARAISRDKRTAPQRPSPISPPGRPAAGYAPRRGQHERDDGPVGNSPAPSDFADQARYWRLLASRHLRLGGESVAMSKFDESGERPLMNDTPRLQFGLSWLREYLIDAERHRCRAAVGPSAFPTRIIISCRPCHS